MPATPRESSLAQLGALAQAFAIEPSGGQRAVETACRSGVRLLMSRDEVVRDEPDSHGNEHDVWFREIDGVGRVFKITRGKHAIYGISGTPAAYLSRWQNSNLLFGDDIRVEGILPDGRFVISQLFVEGKVPSTQELHQALTEIGWAQYRHSGTVWNSPDGRIVMSEVHNGNFIQQPDGTMSAIDVALHSNEEWQAQLSSEEFEEAYGTAHVPQSLAVMLEAENQDLSAFGFPVRSRDSDSNSL